MNNPLVSIIIPTYNRADLIGETLDSVLAQTYANWECIIVDDGSTDNSAEVIGGYVAKDARFKYHQRPIDRPKGGNAARNYGFEVSKGEYINWFDSDDVMASNKLSIQIQALENTNYNFSVCQTLVFENTIENVIGLRHDHIYSEKPIFDFITHQIIFLTQAPVFKRDFLLFNHLLFAEDLLAAQEWEFFCRVFYYSPLYHTTDTPLVLLRQHNSSISYNKAKLFQRDWNYYLAREKVYYFLRKKKFEDKDDVLYYFKFYFRNYLKRIIQKENLKTVIYVFLKSYVPFNTFFKNIKTLAIVLVNNIIGHGQKYIRNI